MLISIVIPYFKKLDLFKIALNYNYRFFAGQDREVVLVLDEPSEEKGVLELIKIYSAVNWRVLVNRQKHEWRSPTKAINVGIRHATGEWVFVCSPESVLTDNLPIKLIRSCAKHDGYACGRVSFCKLHEDNSWTSVGELMPYGSIAAQRKNLIKVYGYSEDLQGWGGDDDLLRRKLDLIGVPAFYPENCVLFHLERNPESRPAKRASAYNYNELANPQIKVNNNWGLDFREVIFDYEN